MVAIEAGWFMTGVWPSAQAIQDILPTVHSHSALTPGRLVSQWGLSSGLCLFLIAEVYLMMRYARLGRAMQHQQQAQQQGIKETIMLDYEALRFIWWLLIGVITVAFMVTC